MKDRDQRTRREFLATSGSTLGAAWLMRLGPIIALTQACASDAARSGRAFTTLTEREAADFDAFAARIVPTDDTPGAREAGVVHFADLGFETFLSELLPVVREGLASLHERVVSTHPGASAFANLGAAEQDGIITAIEEEDPGFFFFTRVIVLMGLMANPEYGGEGNRVGWQILGFDDAFVHQPPFGFYDRSEHGDETSTSGGGSGHR